MDRTLGCSNSLESCEQYFTVVPFVFTPFVIFGKFISFELSTTRSEMVKEARTRGRGRKHTHKKNIDLMIGGAYAFNVHSHWLELEGTQTYNPPSCLHVCVAER